METLQRKCRERERERESASVGVGVHRGGMNKCGPLDHQPGDVGTTSESLRPSIVIAAFLAWKSERSQTDTEASQDIMDTWTKWAH